MAADGGCPARKALEYIERWTDSQECACVPPGPGPEIVCGRCVSLAKARAALSVPCPADQLLAERDLAITHLGEASRKLGAQDAVLELVRDLSTGWRYGQEGEVLLKIQSVVRGFLRRHGATRAEPPDGGAASKT